MAKLKIFVTSNAHIDSEWLWLLEETIEVCKNTFSDILNLMEKYPELTYVQSSSLYYELIEKHYPQIFEKIKSRVKSGNWKLVGGSFLEFDPNMPSGESLVRHFLIGQRYFREKFGVTPETFWLPDSFGFPASLPQLLKKANLEYFVTCKLKWNDTTNFPYYIFKWSSKDTSQVLSLHTPGNYSDYLFSIKKVLLNYYIQLRRQKIPVLMQTFGIGDHGGGPEEEEIINIQKWKKKYRGKFDIEFSGFEAFFNEIKEKYSNILPAVTDDELYLEFHRGVFTTGAKIKWLNRYNENRILFAEKIYSFLRIRYGIEYPKATLDDLWKKILLSHGHDIMSSTVIPEVYLEGLKRGIYVKKRLDSLVKKGLDMLADLVNARYLVFNPASWETSVYVKTNKNVNGYFQELSDGKKLVYIKNLPSLGYRAFSRFKDKPNDEVNLKECKDTISIENKYLTVYISKKTGWILRIYDKINNREVLRAPARLRIYFDYPVPGRGTLVPSVLFDAWEVYNRDIINKYFFKDLKAKNTLVKEKGNWYSSVIVDLEYKQFRRDISKFKLEIGLYADKPYVEIAFQSQWKTWHRLLKFVVPLNVASRDATFEIPYGTVKRFDAKRTKSPKEKAKYEVCGQRWVDVSDRNYGVAIIDDSKYGYSWINGAIELSLLRSPTYPLREALLVDPETYKSYQKSFMDYKITVYRNFIIKVLLHSFFILSLFFAYLRNRKYYRPMDQGKHEARIWIYPHKGNFVEGNVTQVATELNTLYHVAQNNKNLEGSNSLLNIYPQNWIHAMAIKPSEDTPDCLVIRLFNSADRHINAKIKLNFQVEEIKETNLIEEPIREFKLEKDVIKLSFKPHEIKTLFVKYAT